MIEPRPAYSHQFAASAIQPLHIIDPIEQITPEWAWGGSTGKGVKVAIIDSGVDAGHPAVGTVQGYVSVSIGEQGPVYTTEPHEDDFGHGTACAGIIRSIAPDCEIYSVKVLGKNLTGQGNVFAAGLRWAIKEGMQVCNLSLGSTKRDYFAMLHELADRAYFRDIPLVTAGNNMPIPSFPSVFSSVISVGAADHQDPMTFYYNPHPPVEFGAPGINVRVAWKDGGWTVLTGNSFATPHITGIVTLIAAKRPGLKVFQIKSILRALAANVEH